MKKPGVYLIVISFVLFLFSNCKKDDEPQFVHDFGSFTDSRDGHVYKTIEIGTQIWFAENLAYEGAGQEITEPADWYDNTACDGWCYYSNYESLFGSTYGILYQWEVAKVACPTGWHLPTNSDWFVLRDFLGGEYGTGGKLKEAGTTHWISPNTGATNETGFSALPAGQRDGPGLFYHVGLYGHWWSSTYSGSGRTPGRTISYNRDDFISPHLDFAKRDGNSVRCLKD